MSEMALRFRVEASMAEAKASLDQGAAAFRKFGADANTAMKQASTGYSGLTAGMSRDSAITSNVAAQFNDIGVMLAAGQNPFQLAIQQGTQLSQVLAQTGGGIKGAANALKTGFMAMLSPTTLLTIAIIAGGAALVQWAFSATGAVGAAEKAAKATEGYGTSLSNLQGHFSAATSLHSEYVQAVLSGNRDLIRAIELEAQARQAQFNVDLIGQASAREAARSAQAVIRAEYDQTAARVAATQAQIVAAQKAPDTEGKLLELEGLQLSLDTSLDALEKQRAALEKSSAEFAVINAQAGVLEAKMKANGDLITIVKDGLVGTTDALDNAIAPASQLAIMIGRAWDNMTGLNNAAPGAGWLSQPIAEARTLGTLLWDAMVAADAARNTNPTVTRLPGGVDALARGDINLSGRNANGGGVVTRRLPILVAGPSGSSGGGGGGGSTSGSLSDLSSQAQKALADLDLAVAAINEKVKAGLMSTAEAGDAVSGARQKAGNDIATLIAQIDKLGPAGKDAAAALRVSLIDVTADLQKPIDDLSKSLSAGLSAPLKDFMKNAKTADEVFQAFGDSVIDKLIDIALQQAQTNLFEPLISGFLGSLGGSGGLGASIGEALGIGGAGAKISGAESALRAASGSLSSQRVSAGPAQSQSGFVPQVNIKIEGVPAGHTASVDQKSSGMDQMLTVVIEKVEAAIGQNIRTGRGAAGSAIVDTYGLRRNPR